MDRIVFAFEEVGLDLPHPPIAAQRALAVSGIMMPSAVWRELPMEARQKLATAGVAEQVPTEMVRGLLQGSALRKVQLRHPSSEPNPAMVPRDLEWVLGAWLPHVAYRWSNMPALHRYVLTTLAGNPRLLWRALSEIAQRDRWNGLESLGPIHGLLARCEVRIPSESMAYLNDIRFHAGRAGVLARAAGVRAARRVADLLDAHADAAIGPVELEHGPLHAVGVVWQAHVSTVDGTFSAGASLIAATTAAVAMVDMLSEVTENVSISAAGIVDEAWQFGSADNEATLTAF